jgi:hypothetical protein
MATAHPKKAEVQPGQVYQVKVSGKLATVRIERVSPYGGWIGQNLETHRQIRIYSNVRLRRRPAAPDPAPATEAAPAPADPLGAALRAQDGYCPACGFRVRPEAAVLEAGKALHCPCARGEISRARALAAGILVAA